MPSSRPHQDVVKIVISKEENMTVLHKYDDGIVAKNTVQIQLHFPLWSLSNYWESIRKTFPVVLVLE